MQHNANDFTKNPDHQLARHIDHTLLKADATAGQIEKLCTEAIASNFFGVCVNSCWVERVAQLLHGSTVSTVAVVGFPLGAMSTNAKAYEAQWCIGKGAQEIDMVINIGFLKSRLTEEVEKDIKAVVKACGDKKLKVIIETSLLTTEEKILACEIASRAGAHFVKTSTGFGGGGATIDDIALMKRHSNPNMEIKASGGIKNRTQAMDLLGAGASRLGTSSGLEIIQGQDAKGGY